MCLSGLLLAGQAEAAVLEGLTPIQAPTMAEVVTSVVAALAVVHLEAAAHMEAAAAQQEAVQAVKASFAGDNFLVRAGLCSQRQRVPGGANASRCSHLSAPLL